MTCPGGIDPRQVIWVFQGFFRRGVTDGAGSPSLYSPPCMTASLVTLLLSVVHASTSCLKRKVLILV